MRCAWLAVSFLAACGSGTQSTDSIRVADLVVDGTEVTINEQRSEMCFESVLGSAGSRYEIRRRVSADSAGLLVWYPSSAEESERLRCEIIRCVASPDADPTQLPGSCRASRPPQVLPNPSLERP